MSIALCSFVGYSDDALLIFHICYLLSALMQMARSTIYLLKIDTGLFPRRTGPEPCSGFAGLAEKSLENGLTGSPSPIGSSYVRVPWSSAISEGEYPDKPPSKRCSIGSFITAWTAAGAVLRSLRNLG